MRPLGSQARRAASVYHIAGGGWVSHRTLTTPIGHTDRALATESCAPLRGRVDNPKVLLDAVRTRGRFRNEMGRSGVCSLDLHKTFGADGLVATSRAVDIRRIILEGCGFSRVVRSRVSKQGDTPRNKWDTLLPLYISRPRDVEGAP